MDVAVAPDVMVALALNPQLCWYVVARYVGSFVLLDRFCWMQKICRTCLSQMAPIVLVRPMSLKFHFWRLLVLVLHNRGEAFQPYCKDILSELKLKTNPRAP